MKRYGLVLFLGLSGCADGSFNYLSEYENLDLTYQNDPEKVNKTQADTPENLTAYGSNANGSQWGDPTKNPPKTEPFKLETFHGDQTAFNAENVPLRKVKKIDNETLFTEILKCYPSESLFDGSLKLQTTASPIKSRDPDYDNYYAKIVWEMPLYSSEEVTNRLHRENQRRLNTAELLTGFSESIARRNQQLRMVSLYRNLEKRSQKRVLQGLAMAEEQIGYLEKTAQAHTALLRAESDILKFRLQLVSLCTDQKAPKLNALLKKISEYKDDFEHNLDLAEEPTQ